MRDCCSALARRQWKSLLPRNDASGYQFFYTNALVYLGALYWRALVAIFTDKVEEIKEIVSSGEPAYTTPLLMSHDSCPQKIIMHLWVLNWYPMKNQKKKVLISKGFLVSSLEGEKWENEFLKGCTRPCLHPIKIFSLSLFEFLQADLNSPPNLPPAGQDPFEKGSPTPPKTFNSQKL